MMESAINERGVREREKNSTLLYLNFEWQMNSTDKTNSSIVVKRFN